jgi:hypothetical protein
MEPFAAYVGEAVAWYSLDEALALPNLVDRARVDLKRYAEVLLRGGTAGPVRSLEALPQKTDDARP